MGAGQTELTAVSTVSLRQHNIHQHQTPFRNTGLSPGSRYHTQIARERNYCCQFYLSITQTITVAEFLISCFVTAVKLCFKYFSVTSTTCSQFTYQSKLDWIWIWCYSTLQPHRLLSFTRLHNHAFQIPAARRSLSFISHKCLMVVFVTTV
jgi:hypothetical protein